MNYKRIDIYYFTGTGNTLLVVKKLSEVLDKQGFDVNLIDIEKSQNVLLEDNLLIGLAFPVHVQSTNKFLWNFFYNLPDAVSTDVDIFMIDTMASFSGGIVGPLKKLLVTKGYNCIAAKEFIMPSNYKSRALEENNVIIENTLKSVEDFVLDLINGNTKWGRIPLVSDFIRMFSKIDFLWNTFRQMISVDFDRCNQCGICAKLCPLDVISYSSDGFPVINEKCIICMRCVNYCPSNTFFINKKHITQYQPLDLKYFLK